MEVREVGADDLQIYLNLCQAYEAEFSAITGKVPGPDGMFALDTVLGAEVKGYLLLQGHIPVGFAAVRAGAEDREICEFYIVPSMRRQDLGRLFAHRLFALYPGPWQIKQLLGAAYATRFWSRVIEDCAWEGCVQDVYDDPYWGRVVRQCFMVGSGAD